MHAINVTRSLSTRRCHGSTLVCDVIRQSVVRVFMVSSYYTHSWHYSTPTRRPYQSSAYTPASIFARFICSPSVVDGANPKLCILVDGDNTSDHYAISLGIEWIFEIQTFRDSTTHDLFTRIKAPNHCLFHLLPLGRPLHQSTRLSGQ